MLIITFLPPGYNAKITSELADLGAASLQHYILGGARQHRDLMLSLVDGLAASLFKPCTMHQQGESKYVPTTPEPERVTHPGAPRLILKERSDP